MLYVGIAIAALGAYLGITVALVIVEIRKGPRGQYADEVAFHSSEIEALWRVTLNASAWPKRRWEEMRYKKRMHAK